MENLKKIFTTKDFYISACLLASGLKLIELLRKEDKLVVFLFEDEEDKAKEIIRNHWNRTHKIPTRDLIEAINELKTRIHNGI